MFVTYNKWITLYTVVMNSTWFVYALFYLPFQDQTFLTGNSSYLYSELFFNPKMNYIINYTFKSIYKTFVFIVLLKTTPVIQSFREIRRIIIVIVVF